MVRTGGNPDSWDDASLANHSTKPTLANPSAMPTRVPNHSRMFQAVLLPRTSSHLTMRVATISPIATKATVVGSAIFLPNIHNPSADATSSATPVSFKEILPSDASSCEAHGGALLLVRNSGG